MRWQRTRDVQRVTQKSGLEMYNPLYHLKLEIRLISVPSAECLQVPRNCTEVHPYTAVTTCSSRMPGYKIPYRQSDPANFSCINRLLGGYKRTRSSVPHLDEGEGMSFKRNYIYFPISRDEIPADDAVSVLLQVPAGLFFYLKTQFAGTSAFCFTGS